MNLQTKKKVSLSLSLCGNSKVMVLIVIFIAEAIKVVDEGKDLVPADETTSSEEEKAPAPKDVRTFQFQNFIQINAYIYIYI